ncbi:MAG TPA: alpha/beta fold hydrolase [Acidimicrobiales bacterium]|nr:alpha/beta fold hydrolase [Acidimicrobiales bacterium]
MEHFTRQGLTFDLTDAGPADGAAVVLLHGFPEDRSSWDAIVPQLTAAGYRCLAPDQRGYSPRARPPGRRAYRIDELARDVLCMADHAGVDRFHLVGHDWGAAVAWHLAAHHPRRVQTLTALSVPHTAAFLWAMRHSRQAFKSWYMLAFQVPGLAERSLGADGGRRFVEAFTRSGLPREHAERYSRRAGELTGPLSWYRALPWSARRPLPPVEVPTLFVYGEGDIALDRAGADACGRWVTGDYRYEVVAGGGHWLPEVAADRVGPMLLEHLAAHPTPASL